MTLFTKACDRGSAAGCSQLGIRFAQGRGVPKDETRAVALFTKACDGDDADGCFNLGSHSLFGDRPDIARVVALFSKACKGGSSSACHNLGLLYTDGQFLAKDPARAGEAFARGCALGEARSCPKAPKQPSVAPRQH